eukprot:scaffold212413_cov18-Tisochrysis_lutea.AAC.1
MERTAHIYATGQPCVAHGAMHLLRAAHGCKCICCVWRMGPMRCVLSTLWPAGGACAEGEEYALKESFKKAVAQDLRRSYRDSAMRVLKGTNKVAEQMSALPQMLPEAMQTGQDEVRGARGEGEVKTRYC